MLTFLIFLQAAGRWAFGEAARQSHTWTGARDAAQRLERAISTGECQIKPEGRVALVGAGPGAKDLITLRGVRLLQDADVIFYDRLVDPDLLDLARPGAERIFVGKKPGCHSWPQDEITANLIAAAKRGQQVVRLKCGDPGIFARGAEEIAAFKTANIPFEIVPGVTSACGAAAATQTMLTERDVIDTLVLTTGHLSDGECLPDCVVHLQPGTCIALYMAVSAARSIAEHLCRSPFADRIEITAVAEAQTTQQKVIECRPGELADALHRDGIKNTTTIFVRLPRSAAMATKTTTLQQRTTKALETA